MSQPTIVLVNFKFPPNNSVGGRRWAKFAKGLAAEGFRIEVLAAEPRPGASISPWLEDIDHPSITTHFLKRRDLLTLQRKVNGVDLLSRIRRRIYRWLFLRREAGTLYDEAAGVEPQLHRKLRRLIRIHQPKAIIVSGGPYNLQYYVARMNLELRDIHLIADFRDPWIGSPYHGRSELSADRERAELEKLKTVIAAFDTVIAPSEGLINELATPERPDETTRSCPKYAVVTQCYDPDDMPTGTRPERIAGAHTNWVYGGSLPPGVEPYLRLFAALLDDLKGSAPEIYNSFGVTFYTAHTHRAELFTEHPQVVSFRKPIGKRLFSEIQRADGVLLFISDRFRNHITTKVIENLPLGTPYVLLGPPGKLADFVSEQDLGTRVSDFASLQEALCRRVNPAPMRDVQSFSLRDVTRQLIKVVEKKPMTQGS